MGDNFLLKKQLLQEAEEASKLKDLNAELIEHLGYTARRILNYCYNNGIEPPNLPKLKELIQKQRTLLTRMNLH